MTDAKNIIPSREVTSQPDTTRIEQQRPLAPEMMPEQLGTPEAGIEIKPEGFLDETIESLKQALRISKRPKQTQLPSVRDTVTLEVEHIMSAGLTDAYKALPIVKQQEFKLKGEETARAIRDLLRATHVKVKKIFKLLLEWLKMLPGINKFYLEQEAKIKADKIIALKHFDRR